MTNRTLDEMEATAQRQLDGMKTNHDQMANDVLRLVRSIRQAQARAKRTPAADQPGFADRFEQIFGDIFGGAR